MSMHEIETQPSALHPASQQHRTSSAANPPLPHREPQQQATERRQSTAQAAARHSVFGECAEPQARTAQCLTQLFDIIAGGTTASGHPCGCLML